MAFLRSANLWIIAGIFSTSLFIGCGGGGGGEGGAGGSGGEDVGSNDSGMPDTSLMPDMMVEDDASPACECPRNLVCDDDGLCVEVVPCEQDTQCSAGRICVDGACMDGCSTDAECEMADPTLPTCYDGRCGDCEVDDDCFGSGTCDVELHTCVEPEVCTDSRECRSGRSCVAGTCEDAPDCREEGVSCPPGQLCDEDGRCAIDPSGACTSDADCPTIGHVCLEGRGDSQCGPCREDVDCPDGMTCRIRATGNRCTEPETCVDDAECLGSRVCINGACELPQCMDDVYEDNDDAENATPVIAGVLRGLVSCGDDADWYRFTLPPNHAATVSVRQQDNLANLTLSVLNRDGAELARSETDEPVEAVVVGPFPSEQVLMAFVGQAGPLGAAEYVLDVALVDEGEACIDDASETGLGDDTFETGRQLRAPGELGFNGNLSGRLCPDDLDYLCFSTTPREQVTIGIDVTAGDLTVAGRVLREGGELVRNAESTWTRQGGEEISFRAGAGPYCLELGATEGGGSYAVNISAVPSAVLELCEDATPLALNNGSATTQAQLSQEDEFSPICAAGVANGGETIYSIALDDAEQLPVMLTASVSGLPGGTLGDPVVSIRSTCGDASTETGCSTGQLDPLDSNFQQRSPATVRVPVTEPGTYFVVVDGIDIGDRPNYRLDVSTSQLAVAPANNSCEQAQELAFNPDGVTVFGANLDRASDSLSSCIGQEGPDVVYRMTFAERAIVRLQAAAANDAFAVSAFLGQDCHVRDAQICGLGFETVVEPGVYFLVLDGADANARGRVTVQMNVESLGDVPPNETCEAADELPAGGGALMASTSRAADDYRLLDANLCTGNNTIGGDVVYRLVSPEAQMMYVEATPEAGWDLALYVVSDCANPARRRIACSDGALTESVVFDIAADEPVYVIVDGSNGESGSFDLRWGSAECRLDVDCAQGSCVDYTCQL